MIYRFLDCALDVRQYQLYRTGELVTAEPKVLEVLLCLVQQQGQLVTREALLDRCWPGVYVSEETLTRCLSRVRRAVGHNSTQRKLIETVRGKGYRFVGEIDQQPAAVEVPAAPARSCTDPAVTADQPERRLLTVLSCRLLEPVSGNRRRTSDAAQERLRQLCAACAAPLGGYPVAAPEGGFDIYFGFPQALEDAARQAVRGGLRLIEQGGEQSTSPLPVQIGIHSDEVAPATAAGDGEQLALAGPTRALAARLSARSDGRSVMISGATARRLGGDFAWKPADDQPLLTGQGAPLRCYQISGERRARQALPLPAGVTAFVGREAELALLAESWEQVREGLGQVVLLSGEPGIGKSRLAQRFKKQVEGESCRCLELRCSAHHQHTALFPLRAQLQELDAGGEPQLLLRLLLSAGRQGPQLLLIEDLHWADPSTLELIELLIQQAPTARLLVVLSCRPEFAPGWGAQAPVTPLRLERFNRQQTARLIGRLTGGRALAAEVVEQIAAKTDGVPLFIEELVRVLLESGQLCARGQGLALATPIAQLTIPLTLQELLQERLDKLAAGKRVAQWGSVLGREFSHELLALVSGIDEASLGQGVAELLGAGLMYQSGLGGQARYRFKHALVRDSAYQSLLRRQRRQIHGAVARVMEQRSEQTQ